MCSFQIPTLVLDVFSFKKKGYSISLCPYYCVHFRTEVRTLQYERTLNEQFKTDQLNPYVTTVTISHWIFLSYLLFRKQVPCLLIKIHIRFTFQLFLTAVEMARVDVGLPIRGRICEMHILVK